MANRWTRLAGLSALAAYTIYLSFIAGRLNAGYPLLEILFIAYNMAAYCVFVLFVVNTWSGEVPAPKVLTGKALPKVAVIIPTWKEPVQMVRETAMSVLQQNYPQDKLLIAVSDDAASQKIQAMVVNLAREYPDAEFIYNIPPAKNSPKRIGEGKAGNLNSALLLIRNRQDINFIETRDADDIVGHPDFLRHTLGQLVHDPKLAFVQTTKAVFTDKNDKFGNKEEFFYRSVMLFKNAANAVFPCGSGLVWSKHALLDINGFPTWNLVEDFQSGAEALRRGWKGLYIPLVGAIGQIAPSDIANVYKQRGTWALDSLRFLFWGNTKGLTLRQRLHYYDSGIMYIFSALTFLYSFVLAIWLLIGESPISANTIETAIYHFTWLLNFYIFLKALAYKGNVNTRSVLWGMQNMFGLAPVYLVALVKAILYGPNHKPKYKVTRKFAKHSIFDVMYVWPQIVLLTFLLFAIFTHVRLYISQNNLLDVVNVGWAVVMAFIIAKPILNALPTMSLNIFSDQRKVVVSAKPSYVPES